MGRILITLGCIPGQFMLTYLALREMDVGSWPAYGQAAAWLFAVILNGCVSMAVAVGAGCETEKTRRERRKRFNGDNNNN